MGDRLLTKELPEVWEVEEIRGQERTRTTEVVFSQSGQNAGPSKMIRLYYCRAELRNAFSFHNFVGGR
jgi:hypothetical protein